MVDRINRQERIMVGCNIHHGDPCIKGTRIPAAVIVGSLADGTTAEEILQAYPQLTIEDVRAALAYASEIMEQDILLPLRSQP